MEMMSKERTVNPKLEVIADLIEQGVPPSTIKRTAQVGYTEVMAGYRWFRIFTARGYRKVTPKGKAS